MMDFRTFAAQSAELAFRRAQPTKPVGKPLTHTQPSGTRDRYGYADCGIHVVHAGDRFVRTPDEIPTCPVCRQLQEDDEATMRHLGLIR